MEDETLGHAFHGGCLFEVPGDGIAFSVVGRPAEPQMACYFFTVAIEDGVIFRQPLTAEDAVDHLAREDEEMAKWLSGGRSTLANVEKAIITGSRTGKRVAQAGLLACSIVPPIDWSALLR